VRDSAISDRVLLELTAQDFLLWRNPVGAGRMDSGQYVKYGVCNPGGSDLIGLRSVTITPDMVGQRVAIFAAIESKSKNYRVSPPQRIFLNAISRAGGIAQIAKEQLDGSVKRIIWDGD